jgi:hypothetical protein
MLKIKSILLFILVTGSFSFATTWTVDDDGKADFDNIQAAVDAASDGDEIIVMPGTYTSSGNPLIETQVVFIEKQLWIHSSDGSDVTIIDGENISRGIFISFDETNNTVIEGFTITRGSTNQSGGGMLCQATEPAEIAPTITNCIFEYNDAPSGGAIHFSNSDSTLNNCNISNNTAQLGGGISATNSHVDINECTITENTAIYFGGGLLETGGQFVLRYSMLCGNTPDQIYGDWIDGGGSMVEDECPISLLVPQEYATIQAAVDAASDFDEIVVSPGTYTSNSNQVVDFSYKTLTIRSTDGPEVTIIDGQGSRRGVLHLGGTGVIDGFTISNCYVEGEESDGAGLWAQGHITIQNCNFVTNTASGTTTMGGGIFLSGATAALTNCVFEDNHSGYWGGGIAIQYVPAVLTNCTFTNNSSKNGGGLSVMQTWGSQASLVLSGCEFTGNNAYHGGGVYQSLDSGSEFTNCTFTNNTAIFDGGGFTCSVSSNASFVSCSFYDNTVTQGDYTGGGAIYIGYTDILELTDCIMSGNESPNANGIFAYYTQLVFNGTNTSDEMYIEDLSALAFSAESTCGVTGSTFLSPDGTISFDIDAIDTSSSLNASESINLMGGLVVSNNTGSLSGSQLGDVIPLAQASTLAGNFDSIVFPPMPEGLGLQLIQHPALRGGDTEVAAEVIGVEGANFDNPFSGDLDSPPVDIISFDADGDQRDEVAVLFGGTPGGVACYSVSEDGIPTPIDGLIANVGNDPVSIDAGDLNSDGREDLIVANSTDNSIGVLLTMEDIDGSLYFDVLTISVPGSGQSITCVAAIDWDGGTDLDAVVGVNGVNNGYQVLLDVSDTMSTGPWFSIPDYQLPDSSSEPDPPTCVDGGDQSSSWGFVGGTRYGRVHRATSGGSLQVISELAGNNTVTIEAVELDADGGDGQIDLMVSSDEAEAIYLFQGNAAESDGFDDLIPLGVSVPVEDIVAIDADYDGDKDIVMTAPDSTISPLTLLRNDGATGGFVGSLTGLTWSKQIMNSGNPPGKITSGGLNGKDEDDDWIVGGAAGAEGIRGEPAGTLEQTNLLGDINTCNPDINGDGYVNVSDLLAVIDQWGLTDSPADISGDGIVNVTDLLEVVGNWGPCL